MPRLGRSFNNRRGPTGNPLIQQALERRAVQEQIQREAGWRIGVVYRYDRDTNMVDILFKDEPGGQPLRNVRVVGMGGNGFRHYAGLHSILDGAEEPDVGIVLFPPGDARRLFEDYAVRQVHSNDRSMFAGPLFLPGLPIDTQTQPEVEAGDHGLLTPEGYGVIVKSTGELVLRGKKVYLLTEGQEIDDAQPIARSGDSTDGTGSITSGSGGVFSS